MINEKMKMKIKRMMHKLFSPIPHREGLGVSLFILLLFLAGCKTTGQKPTVDEQKPVSIMFIADSAYAFCQKQCDFGPRTMNSEAHEKCAEWIRQKFEEFGYQVEMQKADVKGYDGTVLHATNIIARGAKSEAQGTRARILVCAHWDSRPWADNDPDPANHHTPVMAANDGASGVGVMLELARLIKQHGDSLNVDVDFVCFDAEDWGFPQWSEANDPGNTWALGSQHWAAAYSQQQTADSPKYQYGILLDMVGGQGARFYQELMSKQYAGGIVDKVWAAAKVAGYGSVFPTEEGGGITDDHLPVNQVAGVPCIDIIPHYPECRQSSFGSTWHTVSDDMAHLDRATLQAVGQTMLQVLFSEK